MGRSTICPLSSCATVTLRLPLLQDAVTVRVLKADAQAAGSELGRVDYPQVAP